MAKSSTRLVLICGLPASGKSTLARQLAFKTPAVRLDKDGWATQLGADLWDDEFRVRLEHQLWLLTQDLLARGQSVILEWGHWARVERDEKRLGARALGVEVELHYLHAPLEELIERAERRNESADWTASPIVRGQSQVPVFGHEKSRRLAVIFNSRRAWHLPSSGVTLGDGTTLPR